jgi:hypothetical protein
MEQICCDVKIIFPAGQGNRIWKIKGRGNRLCLDKPIAIGIGIDKHDERNSPDADCDRVSGSNQIFG